MHANNFIINNRTAWQTIKRITECFPKFYAEATTAFIIKPIYAVDTCAFMVTPQNKEIFWILDFVSKKEAHYFK